MELKIQVLAISSRTGKSERGEYVRHDLQCFVDQVVGVIPSYDPDFKPEAGFYMASIGWSNYQGRLQPRIEKLTPISQTREHAREQVKA